MENHILVVDDEKSVRRVFQKLLEQAGYACTTASDGKEAIKFLAKNNVDVVITDINMPHMDGVQLLRIVKERHDAHVIVMTGVDAGHTYGEVVGAGAIDFFKKSSTARELMVRVGRVIEQRTQLRTGET